MAEPVYILCALTSLAVVMLLLRAYLKWRVRLLLWSGLCFAGLSMTNILLVADLVFFPNVDLSLFRDLSALMGMSILLAGFILDAKN